MAVQKENTMRQLPLGRCESRTSQTKIEKKTWAFCSAVSLCGECSGQIQRRYNRGKRTSEASGPVGLIGNHKLVTRSLGFVEIQGKDTGGIYHKLEEWLIKNWGAKKKDRDLMEVVNPEQECGT